MRTRLRTETNCARLGKRTKKDASKFQRGNLERKGVVNTHKISDKILTSHRDVDTGIEFPCSSLLPSHLSTHVKENQDALGAFKEGSSARLLPLILIVCYLVMFVCFFIYLFLFIFCDAVAPASFVVGSRHHDPMLYMRTSQEGASPAGSSGQ